MHIFKNPRWIDSRLLADLSLDEIPVSIFDEINRGLAALQTAPPVVSVVIPVLNEEMTILRTLHSLAASKTRFPVEVIVVNNNSSDRTQEVLNRLNVKSVFQPKEGWGPARQMGQEHASGKYVLMADADCFYPPTWIQRMTKELMKDGVTCVYGGYSFLGSRDKSRWKFSIYESLRYLVSEIRHIHRPWYNSVGMCMGYVRDLGLRVGFVDHKIRGEDGRMCYELAQLGKIVRVRSKEVVVWTVPRTFKKDRSLVLSILDRAVIEIARFRLYLQKQPVHNTHTSANFTHPSLRYFRKSALSSKDKSD